MYPKKIMSNEKNNDTPNLSQNAYVLMGSYLGLTRSLFRLCAGSLIFLLFAAVILSSQEDKNLAIFFLFYFLFFLSIFIAYFISSRKFSKTLEYWTKNYFEQIYTIIFNTTIPKGNNEVENLLDLSRYIFPELQYDYVKYSHDYLDKLIFIIKSKLTASQNAEEMRILKAHNHKVNGYFFDFALKTQDGYFIIKNFQDNVVNIDDIKLLVQKAKSKYKDKHMRTRIFRILIVSKNYDELFLKRESLERVMSEEIDTNVKIDLIVKENRGYSVLWIS
jgi:hypothetical protein